jgi:hypothetical protein
VLKSFINPGKEFAMNDKPAVVEMSYRLLIGVALLLLALFADMSIGPKVVIFLIAAVAFIEAFIKSPKRDKYSRNRT